MDWGEDGLAERWTGVPHVSPVLRDMGVGRLRPGSPAFQNFLVKTGSSHAVVYRSPRLNNASYSLESRSFTTRKV